jgi:hypothetical protein
MHNPRVHIRVEDDLERAHSSGQFLHDPHATYEVGSKFLPPDDSLFQSLPYAGIVPSMNRGEELLSGKFF